MSTNPLPDAPQPQYRLLYQFNLIWLLITAVFFVAAVVLAVSHFPDLEKKYQDFRVTVEEKMKADMNWELKFNPEP